MEKSLKNLINKADKQILEKLIINLTDTSNEVLVECLEFLGKKLDLNESEKESVSSYKCMAIWNQIQWKIEEFDDYGGGDEQAYEEVGGKIYEIIDELENKQTVKHIRIDLVEEIFPYIESGNAGLDDELHALVNAACYDEEDFRLLAQKYEKSKNKWNHNRAMRIYRKIGDDDKYLEMRKADLKYGNDYHDLATFYFEKGNQEEAITEFLK